MVKTSSLATEFQNFARTTDATALATAKERMNAYYRNILRDCDNYVIERTKYGQTKANQRGYLTPPDYIKMIAMRVWSGNEWHPVDEEQSMSKWHERIRVTYTSPYPDRYFVYNEQGNLHVELDPVPSADGVGPDADNKNFELIYQGTQDPLYFPADVTATAAVEQGSAAFTTSTSVLTASMVGKFVQVSGGKYWYEIKSITDGTHGVLVNYFQEDDNAAATITIAEMQRTPEEFHYTPLWGALMDYWLLPDLEKSKEFEKRYARDIVFLQAKYQNKTKGNVTPGRLVGGAPMEAPKNYPTTLLSRL